MTYRVALLPGDGVGPEVIAEARKAMILAIRQRLDLWANLRPCRLLHGIPGPLAGCGPADVDMLFVRENTEGEYAGCSSRCADPRPPSPGAGSPIRVARSGARR